MDLIALARTSPAIEIFSHICMTEAPSNAVAICLLTLSKSVPFLNGRRLNTTAEFHVKIHHAIKLVSSQPPEFTALLLFSSWWTHHPHSTMFAKGNIYFTRWVWETCRRELFHVNDSPSRSSVWWSQFRCFNRLIRVVMSSGVKVRILSLCENTTFLRLAPAQYFCACFGTCWI